VGRNREYGSLVFKSGRKLNKVKGLLPNTYTSRDVPPATRMAAKQVTGPGG
jgi:hypothetical protein